METFEKLLDSFLLFSRFFSKKEVDLLMKKPVLLCIMDGFGKNESDFGNAIAAA